MKDAVIDAGVGAVTAGLLKGGGALVKAAVRRAPAVTRALGKVAGAAGEGVNNPIPSRLARVIPGEGPFPTFGLPGSTDVFVTAAHDIAGMNAGQIAQRLRIPRSPTFTVIEFGTPAEGLASPILRSDPRFVGRGLTGGGAREFVLPNGPVPSDAAIRTVGP
jgi:hypothetical protein